MSGQFSVRARWESVPNNHKGMIAQGLARYKHFNVYELISRAGVVRGKSTALQQDTYRVVTLAKFRRL